MIRSLITFAIIVFGFIVGASYYLQPNDLSDCGDKPDGSGKCKVVDAIVAISGGDTKARVNEAIKLFNNGWSTKIIFSGAAKDKSGPSNAAEMKAIAIAAGISEDSIYIDEYAETTKQNAQNSESIFNKMDIDTVILVTSGYHQRRAGLEFSKHSTSATVLNHPVASDKDWSMWWWLTPRGWWLAVGELVKIIAFYMVGA